MKKIAGLLALLTLAFAQLVLASAVVTSATGTVQAQTGTGAPWPVRVGDRLNQGDTVITGPVSSVVMKFDDGQVAALTANSRMTITTYAYRRESQQGNVLLSLVTGGMRLITGLIAKNKPENVSVRAATATIGIRGTDFTVITAGGTVYAHVDAGSITFTINGQSITVDTGRAVLTNPNGTVSQGTINQIFALLQGTELGREIAALLGGLQGLSAEITRAFPGTPPQGQGTPPDTVPGAGSGPGQGTPTGPSGPGGGGGGRPASPS